MSPALLNCPYLGTPIKTSLHGSLFQSEILSMIQLSYKVQLFIRFLVQYSTKYIHCSM
jgi:hypothetical protein